MKKKIFEKGALSQKRLRNYSRHKSTDRIELLRILSITLLILGLPRPRRVEGSRGGKSVGVGAKIEDQKWIKVIRERSFLWIRALPFGSTGRDSIRLKGGPRRDEM